MTKKAKKIVTEEMVSELKPGDVFSASLVREGKRSPSSRFVVLRRGDLNKKLIYLSHPSEVGGSLSARPMDCNPFVWSDDARALICSDLDRPERIDLIHTKEEQAGRDIVLWYNRIPRKPNVELTESFWENFTAVKGGDFEVIRDIVWNGEVPEPARQIALVLDVLGLQSTERAIAALTAFYSLGIGNYLRIFSEETIKKSQVKQIGFENPKDVANFLKSDEGSGKPH